MTYTHCSRGDKVTNAIHTLLKNL
ncbi:rCG39095 [Rattus norvegicus]|uniref:RCG39095 n=1 Tax=Rattus norvegicus TaxID=10116 RepID=A6JXW1_RAT|nr:rCG39095 [Rattus norvegicus]